MGNEHKELPIKELFDEALMDSIFENPKQDLKIPAEIYEEKVVAVEVEKEISNWDDLEKAMKGELANRFLDIMRILPDRTFATNYLKAAEFFKAKLNRQEIVDSNKEDNVIVVQINRANEPKTIDVTPNVSSSGGVERITKDSEN